MRRRIVKASSAQKSNLIRVAYSDLENALSKANNSLGTDLYIEGDHISVDNTGDDNYDCYANITDGDCIFTVSWPYLSCSDGDTACEIPISELVKEIKHGYNQCIGVEGSTYISAAGDDDDEFGTFDDTDDLADSIDDLADNVDEMQDAVEEVQEDDPSIEMENNIENHYIAECESCGGIFISAILESDQEIDHVTGVCPLCEKETNQYLKWVIRPAEFDDDEDMVEDDQERSITDEVV